MRGIVLGPANTRRFIVQVQVGRSFRLTVRDFYVTVVKLTRSEILGCLKFSSVAILCCCVGS